MKTVYSSDTFLLSQVGGFVSGLVNGRRAQNDTYFSPIWLELEPGLSLAIPLIKWGYSWGQFWFIFQNTQTWQNIFHHFQILLGGRQLQIIHSKICQNFNFLFGPVIGTLTLSFPTGRQRRNYWKLIYFYFTVVKYWLIILSQILQIIIIISQSILIFYFSFTEQPRIPFHQQFVLPNIITSYYRTHVTAINTGG